MTPSLTVTRSPGIAMTRLMMYWSLTLFGTEQVIGFLTPSDLYLATASSSSFKKTMIWPRSGTYSWPVKCAQETAARLTITRSS